MRYSIFHSMFASGGGGGGGRIWRWIGSGYCGRMLMSTMGAPSTSPWLMLPPGRDSNSGNLIHNFYSLGENKKHSFDGGFALEDGTRFVGSSHGWLALFNARDNHLFLTNPLSKKLIPLPPLDKLPNPEINLTNGRASVSKLVLSCSPDVGKDECRALIAYGPGNLLAFCSAGHSDGWGWDAIGREDTPYKDCYGKFRIEYNDFVYCRPGKSFICFSSLEDALCIEYCSIEYSDEFPFIPLCGSIYRPSWIKEIPKEFNTNSGEFGYSFYLVFLEQMNQLLYLVRFVSKDNKTVRFLVFRVDNKHRLVNKLRLLRPDQGDSLDGLAIFVGINHSFAITAADFPNIEPNSIYFASPDSVDIEIFDFQSQTVSPCYSPSQVESIVSMPLWFSSTPN